MSRLASFRRTLALTLCTGALVGAGLAVAARPARAGIEEANKKCKSLSECEAGSYNCSSSCAPNGGPCTCTIT